MSSRLVRSLLGSALLVSATFFANVAVAGSAIAQKYFDGGNAAFRQGDFGAALADYSDALANGKDSSRLFYNMGLAHYRLGQYPQAKWAFYESAKDDELAALSYYHLGVLAREGGNMTEAAAWFSRARKTAESKQLRRQSSKALTVIGVARPAFDASISVGLGYDSNAYRAPDTPYIDVSQGTPTAVVPVPQSGPYVPIRIRGDYLKPLSALSRFVASYRFRGDYHTDTELENADVTDHRLALGGERMIGSSESADRRIALAAVYRNHAEINYDRDDGLDRFDDGQSIADRFNFQSLGAEADLKNRIGITRFELNGGWELRDYDDVPTASSYDMTMYWIGGDIKFPLSDNSRVKLSYQYYIRDYDERRSRDSTGDASILNPTIEYQYNVFEAGLRHRFNDWFLTELVYNYTIRNDEFVGYNDYTRSKIRLTTTFDFTNRLRTRISFAYRDQDYPNAFAFDDPSQPRKEYQELEVVAMAEYQLTDRVSLRADFKQELVESSDPRGEYDRTRTAIGVFWDF